MILEKRSFPFYYEVELTTDHAASSHAVPVLLIGGHVYTRDDFLWNGIAIAKRLRKRFDRLDPDRDCMDISDETRERHALIDRFCGQQTPLPVRGRDRVRWVITRVFGTSMALFAVAAGVCLIALVCILCYRTLNRGDSTVDAPVELYDTYP